MTQTTHFFLGANSGEGFQNLYPLLTDREDTYDLMILKGGPGVKKSDFLKQLGKTMEEAGVRTEYLWCAGDPESLDGVAFPDLKTAAVDGTEPHVLEPEYPGAVDRCVDLGRFYDLTAAKAARPEVLALSRSYRSAYARACHSLKAARQMELDGVTAVRQTMDWQRANRRLNGIIARELRRRGGEAGKTTVRFLGGMTRKGWVWRFDTVDALCPRVYVLADSYELAGDLLERLHATAARQGWDTITCMAPEEPSRIEHLLIPGLGLAFVTSKPGMEYGKKPYRRMRLDAMAQPENRARLRFEARMTGILREEARSALEEAKEVYDRLEEVYAPYVDDDGIQATAALETGRLLSYLK